MEWIKVEEKMPDEKQVVLVVTKDFSMFICRYRKALTWKGFRLKFINLLSTSGIWVQNVTHWMPMPELPKE